MGRQTDKFGKLFSAYALQQGLIVSRLPVTEYRALGQVLVIGNLYVIGY